MTNIAISTIAVSNSYNYGNKLQAYALQSFLKAQEYGVQIIRYETYYGQNNCGMCTSGFVGKIENVMSKLGQQSLCQSLADAYRIGKRTVYKATITRKTEERKRKFDAYAKRNILFTEDVYYHDSEFCKLRNEFDLFITGSDQVWNPYYEGTNAFYYLNFAPKGKRIAYAPSFGYERIPEHMEKQYAQWLSQIDALSAREESGRQLLKEQFGLDAKLVCDPVFLIDRQEWSSIAQPVIGKSKYFAVYILGKKSNEIKKLIRKFEKTYQMKAVDIYTRDDPKSIFAGPEEFLGIIENAEFVLTDSFHGTCFSLIFNKPMAITKRNKEKTVNTRMESLLKKVGIGNREAEWILEDKSRMYLDFEQPMKKLNAFVSDSKEYLLSSIERGLSSEAE